MEKKKKIILAITIILVIIFALALNFLIINWIIGPGCIPATRENGRFDVNNDEKIDFQDSGLININSIEVMENYVYNMTCDMNCDSIVDVTDVDLCWQNRD